MYFSYIHQDHAYSTIDNTNDIPHIDDTYERQSIIGYIMVNDCGNLYVNQPLYEFYSESLGDHMYTTNLNEMISNNDYAYIDVVGYVAVE